MKLAYFLFLIKFVEVVCRKRLLAAPEPNFDVEVLVFSSVEKFTTKAFTVAIATEGKFNGTAEIKSLPRFGTLLDSICSAELNIRDTLLVNNNEISFCYNHTAGINTLDRFSYHAFNATGESLHNGTVLISIPNNNNNTTGLSVFWMTIAIGCAALTGLCLILFSKSWCENMFCKK